MHNKGIHNIQCNALYLLINNSVTFVLSKGVVL